MVWLKGHQVSHLIGQIGTLSSLSHGERIMFEQLEPALYWLVVRYTMNTKAMQFIHLFCIRSKKI